MFTPVNLNTMTARGLKYISTNNDEERTRLIDTSDEINSFHDLFPKEKKKRARKLSDDSSSYTLVDVGNAPKAPPLDQCVETEVQPGDTLASLSLKYNVQVAELKRVNNLLTDGHFYALKRIKIPVKTASLLTELLPSVHEAKGEAKLGNGWFIREVPSPTILTGGTSSTVPSTPPSDTEHELLSIDHAESLIPPEAAASSNSKQTKKVKKFLKNYDKDIARIKERLDIDDDEDEPAEVVPLDFEAAGAKVGFVDSIRASRSRTACCLFLVIITVIVIVILIFAHQEFGVIEEKHHHHVSTRHASSSRKIRHFKH